CSVPRPTAPAPSPRKLSPSPRLARTASGPSTRPHRTSTTCTKSRSPRRARRSSATSTARRAPRACGASAARATSCGGRGVSITRAGHFQPQYGGATIKVPEKPVAAGQQSEWINIGPFCRLVHDEGLTLTLPGAGPFDVQVARDPAGKDVVGDVKLSSGETLL